MTDGQPSWTDPLTVHDDQLRAMARQLERDTGCPRIDHAALAERLSRPIDEYRRRMADAHRQRLSTKDLNLIRSLVDDPKELDLWLQDGPVRGRPFEGQAFPILIWSLAHVYFHVARRWPGVSMVHEPGGRERTGGPFVRFCEAVLQIIEPNRKRKRKNIGQSVAKALRQIGSEGARE